MIVEWYSTHFMFLLNLNDIKQVLRSIEYGSFLNDIPHIIRSVEYGLLLNDIKHVLRFV